MINYTSESLQNNFYDSLMNTNQDMRLTNRQKLLGEQNHPSYVIINSE